MKEISPLSNISNLPAAMSSLNRFFVPVDVEVANQGRVLFKDVGFCFMLSCKYLKHAS